MYKVSTKVNCSLSLREIFHCPGSSLSQWTNVDSMCGFLNLVSILSLACLFFFLLDGLRSVYHCHVYMTPLIPFSFLRFKSSVNSSMNGKREMEAMFGKKLNNLEIRIFELKNLNKDLVERKDKSECHEQVLRNKFLGSEEITQSFSSWKLTHTAFWVCTKGCFI